jgi:hypothetical protein
MTCIALPKLHRSFPDVKFLDSFECCCRTLVDRDAFRCSLDRLAIAVADEPGGGTVDVNITGSGAIVDLALRTRDSSDRSRGFASLGGRLLDDVSDTNCEWRVNLSILKRVLAHFDTPGAEFETVLNKKGAPYAVRVRDGDDQEPNAFSALSYIAIGGDKVQMDSNQWIVSERRGLHYSLRRRIVGG